jgi:hypothetical protein
MTKPLIQIDDEVREMTDEEYAQLLATGWTMEGTNEATTADADTGTSPE